MSNELYSFDEPKGINDSADWLRYFSCNTRLNSQKKYQQDRWIRGNFGPKLTRFSPFVAENLKNSLNDLFWAPLDPNILKNVDGLVKVHLL